MTDSLYRRRSDTGTNNHEASCSSDAIRPDSPISDDASGEHDSDAAFINDETSDSDSEPLEPIMPAV